MFAIRKHEPIFDFPVFSGDIDEFFNAPFEAAVKDFGFSGRLHPAVETYKSGDNYLIKADIPGIDPKDVDISFEDDILTIKGKREARHLEEGEECLMSESAYGSFERRLRLGEDIQADKIHASYKDGVLQITLPVKESSKPRKITIESAEH